MTTLEFDAYQFGFEYHDEPFDMDNYINEEYDISIEIDASLIGVDQDLPF